MDLFPTWTLTLLLGIIVVLVVFLKTDFRGKSKRTDKSGFERFLEEWEKENEAFLRTFSEVHRDLMKRIDRLEERVENWMPSPVPKRTARCKNYRKWNAFETAGLNCAIATKTYSTWQTTGCQLRTSPAVPEEATEKSS